MKIKIEVQTDNYWVAETLSLLALKIENHSILDPLYDGEVTEVVEEEYNAKFTVVPDKIGH